MSRLALPLLALAGCFHTTLNPPPPPTAPVGDRLAAYNALRATGELHTITVTANQYGASVNHETDLVLASGETVRHADDLLPVLDAGSPAARSARRSGDARGKKWGWMLGGSAVMVAGMAYAFSGINSDPLDDEAQQHGNDRFAAGMTVALIAGLAGTIGGFYYQHVERSQRRAAFANYDDALRARLALCVSGMQLVDCNAAPPVYPMGPQVGPPPAPIAPTPVPVPAGPGGL